MFQDDTNTQETKSSFKESVSVYATNAVETCAASDHEDGLNIAIVEIKSLNTKCRFPRTVACRVG
jgi:hypothetical protein